MSIRDKEIVIIGAGLSGLSAASYLSNQGAKVTILEKLHQAGGYVHSFKRGNYMFEASTHQILGGGDKCLKDTFKQLKLDSTLLTLSKTMYETVLYNRENNEIERRITLPCGILEIKKKLYEEFPNSKKEIDAYYKIMSGIGKEVLRFKCIGRKPVKNLHYTLPALMLRNGKGIFKRIGKRFFSYTVKYINTSQEDISRFIKNEELIWLINTYSVYTGCPIDTVSAIVHNSINYLYFFEGPYLIKGGTINLINQFIKEIEKNDGKIVYKQAVSKINIKNNEVTSVETDNGYLYECDAVISAINSRDTILNCIEASVLPAKYLESIKNVEYTTSVFQVYLGLKIKFSDYGFQSSTTFFSNSLDHISNFDSLKSTVPHQRAKTPFIITNYSVVDGTMAPKGHSVICIAELMPLADWENLTTKEYKARKNEIQNIIIDKVERVTGVPIKNNIEVIFSGTPRTMKYYSSSPNGAMAGASLTVEQSLNRRTPVETPVRNLFLAGSSISPAGVSGSMESGIVSSNILMRKL